MLSGRIKKPFFIAVEGPIGVGKSSLAKLISERYQFYLLKEIVEENPFLGKFYDDLDEWAFQTEMFFLTNRYKQLEDTAKNYLYQNKSVVADYHIFKNHIFSKRTLTNEQYDKYSKIYDILLSDKEMPNMVIYLNASLETLLERINLRGRTLEQKIKPDYLEQLSYDYQEFMKEFKHKNPKVTVLEFNGDVLDFMKNENDKNYIFKEIDKKIFFEEV